MFWFFGVTFTVHQYTGAAMSIAPIYWSSFASCTISFGASTWTKLTKVLEL